MLESIDQKDLKQENQNLKEKHSKDLSFQYFDLVNSLGNKVPYTKIEFWNKTKEIFEKFLDLTEKCKIHPESLLKFYILIQKNGLENVSGILKFSTFKHYLEYLKEKTKQKKILKFYFKSVKNIALDCSKSGEPVKEYLMNLAKAGKMAGYFLSGKISAYYFCALDNFKELYEAMDAESKRELERVFKFSEMYKLDLSKAFKDIYSKPLIPPILFSEILATKFRNNLKIV